ncbi:MAG TPA: NAAT family transporter [Gallionellaceae bacterium]
MLEFTEYTKIFISLFAVLDPVGIIPIIIAFTAGMRREKRARVGQMASLSVCGILLVALLVGQLLLEFFGISINSFRTAGGILLLLMSITMLTGPKPFPSDVTDGDATRSSLAIVPLSTPLLAGPGAISTVIVDAHKGTGVAHYAILTLVIILLSFTVWLTFLAAPQVEKRMGQTGIYIFTRLMGLVLASIAVEFIAGGLKGLFPALG